MYENKCFKNNISNITLYKHLRKWLTLPMSVVNCQNVKAIFED